MTRPLLVLDPDGVVTATPDVLALLGLAPGAIAEVWRDDSGRLHVAAPTARGGRPGARTARVRQG